jgi:hypothetical protein
MSDQRPSSIMNILIYLVIGMCVGFLILHPVSMLIEGEGHGVHGSLRELFRQWFSRSHRSMSVYFTVLGGAVGMLQGILGRKLVERNMRVLALEGLLPICASCKRIRETDKTGKETWVNIEQFISRSTAADFTHSICPDCTRRLYPDFAEKKETPE